MTLKEAFNIFLESSSIHGLNHISTSKRYHKLFWITVVIFGFTGAGIIIYEAFQSWEDSPVKTTIETRPITDLTFPKVTVCPPRDTYTDLNFDLKILRNMTLDNDTRSTIMNYAYTFLWDHLNQTIMKNMMLIEDHDRYSNWYQGYTKITIPHFASDPSNEKLHFKIYTSASSGTLQTAQFGQNFDADKFLWSNFFSRVNIQPPKNFRDNVNVTLHFEVEKISNGKDKLKIDNVGYIDNKKGKTITHKSYNPPEEEEYYIEFETKDNPDELTDQQSGFRFSWYFSGLKDKPDPMYMNKSITRAFVRNCSRQLMKLLSNPFFKQ